MNKSELIKEIADETKLSQNDVAKFLNALISVTEKTLKKQEPITIIDFGTFSIADRAERTAMNFQTNKPTIVPACKVVKFKLSQRLKNALK